jgi:hypothetical protein
MKRNTKRKGKHDTSDEYEFITDMTYNENDGYE